MKWIGKLLHWGMVGGLTFLMGMTILSNALPQRTGIGHPGLVVEEVDGDPSAKGVGKIIVANDTLTKTSNTNVTISTGAGGSTIAVDGEEVSNPDFQDGGDGNFTATDSNITLTINPGAVDPIHMANDDFGDFTFNAGSATIDANAVGETQIDTSSFDSATSWGDDTSDASIAWTWALSGATDPVMTFADNAVAVTTGNVGIGTTTPVAKLEVNGTSKFGGVINTNNQWISGDGGAEGIYIDDLGNVGIGTTALSDNRLTIVASTGNSGKFYVEAGPSGNRADFVLKAHNASNNNDKFTFSLRTDQSPDVIAYAYDDSASAYHNFMHYDYVIEDVYITGAYNTEISGTFCDLQVDNNGKLGCESSSEAMKTNIRDIDSCDVYALRPRVYDRLDSPVVNEIGLIAEEVAQVYPAAVVYERGETILKEYPDSPPDKEYFATDKPAGINYSKLIVPMLIELKNLKAEIDTLKAEVEALKQ